MRDNRVTVKWESRPGALHTVESSPTLSAESWKAEGTAAAEDDFHTFHIDLGDLPPKAFVIRVRRSD